VEEEELLSEDPALKHGIPFRLIAVVLAFIVPSFQTLVYAGTFEDTAREGMDFGKSIRPGQIPQNIEEIVPRYREADEQKDSFTQYYTNPGDMPAAGSTAEAREFVADTYSERPKFDLSYDQTFGNRCLHYEVTYENGQEVKRCTMWSTSRTILNETYADCERVLLPRYETSELRTCTGEVRMNVEPECTVRRILRVEAEDFNGSCSSSIPVQGNQIFAVCKEYVVVYRVYVEHLDLFAGHYRYVDDVLCDSANGWWRCSYCYDTGCPSNAAVVSESELPPGAELLGHGVMNVWASGSSGSRVGHGDHFKFYKVRLPSKVERVFLDVDSTCSESDLTKWVNECTIKDYVKCNSSGTNCVYIIQDGQETGNQAPTECQYADGTIVVQGGQVCSPECTSQYDTCREECKIFYDCTVCTNCGTCTYGGCCSSCENCSDRENGLNCTNCTGCTNCGICDSNYSSCISDCNSQYSSCTGNCSTQRDSCLAGCGSNQSCRQNCENQYNTCMSGCSSQLDSCNSSCSSERQNCLNTCSGTYSCSSCSSCSVDYDSQCVQDCQNQFCQQSCQSGSWSGYNVCIPPDSSEYILINGSQATSTPVSTTWSTNNEYNYPITWQSVTGGSGVRPIPNDWYAKFTFVCREESSSCQDLIDQGCVYAGSQCANEECTEYIYTYRCGKDRITGYDVAYVCAGEIRCIGTECGEASYEASQDFALAAQGTEILNMARVDSVKQGENFEIFPGKVMRCQSDPKNCCKPTTGSLSLGDYVTAARNMYSLYQFASSGFEAVAAEYATNATTVINTLASKLGIGNVSTSVTQVGSYVTTQTTIETQLGTTNLTTTMFGSNMSTTGAFSSPAGSMVTAGTVLAAVQLILICYSVLSFLYNYLFACTDEDMQTSVMLGYKLCHYIGTLSRKKFGFITQRWRYYCCYNSILARIVHEQGRAQIGKDFGNPRAPHCEGFTIQEFSSIDMSRIDLSEYMQYVTQKTTLTDEEIQNIEQRLKEKYTQGINP
jgi:hypothetical protein